jgi:glucokinase
LGNRLSAKDIGDAARKGNKIALNIYRNAGQHVGIGIGSLLNVLNPEIVILGGGVLKSAPKIFWSTLIKSAKKYAWQEAIASTKIVKASLGDKVGNFGALALAFV